MRRSTQKMAAWVGAGLVSAWVLAPTPAKAANHLWEFSEIYTNADGSMQFIEMHNHFNTEGFLQSLTITANNAGGTDPHVFTFPGNTTDPINTADHSILIATPGFGSLPGGVTPDFTIPAGFLFANGTLDYPASGDFVAYSLPTDGVMSLTRNTTTHVFAPAVNSPENFAGAVGSVPEPATAAGALLCLAPLALLRHGFPFRRRR